MSTSAYPGLVGQLGQMAASTTTASLPAEVRASIPQRVLDILGLCVAATRLPTSATVMALAASEGGRPQATAIGVPERLPAARAAFVNGVLAHSLDYDDTHLPSILHPSASVVPAALAAAEYAARPGFELVAAVAVGLEVAVRIGMAGYSDEHRQSEFFEHGQHATSITGAIGSAAAAAKLLGGSAETCAHAMAIACSMASGIIEANRTGGTVKRLHCGFAAQSGVTAALLAHGGITGAPTALEGRFGFFEAFLRDRWDAAPILDGLGEAWCAADIFYKPYPANHFTHAGIDAAISLRERGVRPGDVARAELRVASPTVRTIGEPLADKQRPATGYQAQFSGPYTVAAALHGGHGLGLGLADFTDALAADPARRELMARITVVGDARCDAIYPYQFPAILTIETADGATHVAEVLTNRGGPGRPLSAAELATKFADNVAGLLAADTVAAVTGDIGDLGQLGSIAPTMASLQFLDSPAALADSPPATSASGSVGDV